MDLVARAIRCALPFFFRFLRALLLRGLDSRSGWGPQLPAAALQGRGACGLPADRPTPPHLVLTYFPPPPVSSSFLPPRRSGVFNDLGSGSNVDLCIITKDGVEYRRNHEFLQVPGRYCFVLACWLGAARLQVAPPTRLRGCCLRACKRL